MEKIWLKNYPAGVPAEINQQAYDSILDVFKQSCMKFAAKTAYSNMGCRLSYTELEAKTRTFAAYLQNTLKLQKGDRIAIMLPNLLQYPVAMFAAFRIGLIVVNVNPLYTARELIHQLTDTGAKAIVVLSNFAHTLQQALPETKVKHVIVTDIGDLLPFPKSVIVNLVVKYIKKMVPAWDIPHAIPYKKVLQEGAKQILIEAQLKGEDIAYLQSTSGTTGIAKSAVLLHRNMVANMLQMSAWVGKDFGSNEVMVTPLPLYHIFSLCINCLMIMKIGGESVLITNPRDIPNFVKELHKIPFTAMSGVNTLFNALLNNEEFKKLDFSRFKLTAAGGMALQSNVAEKWHQVTGHYISEGYGLTETSPVVTINPVPTTFISGSIGLPTSSTEIDIRDEDGKSLPVGEVGELCVKGPQVMQGYWQRPEETAKVFTEDGWLRTGDMIRVDEKGFCYIVDRKKNMIIVSGFNVYPSEVEDVIASMPGVLEVAVIGVADQHSNEAVKAFIVKKDSALTEQAVINYCHQNLTRYKVPKFIEFRTELPKTNVGKILHRVLRDEAKAA